MKIAVTGHRPNKLGGYSDEAFESLALFAELMLNVPGPKPQFVFTGMTLGWDQAIAEACWSLEIPFVACIPCEGQERKWPQESQERYQRLLNLATKVVVVNPGGYASWKMLSRDYYMVDQLTTKQDKLLALYNGDEEGGTYKTVLYANNKNKVVENCWKHWLEFNKATANA
jgi:uncharacterized phage-like protein YoqJ